MSDSIWRDRAAPIIAATIAAHPDGVGLPAALREAYPFGERKYHPYKIWLDEIARQLGRKPKLGTVIKRPGIPTLAEPDPNQLNIFGESDAK